MKKMLLLFVLFVLQFHSAFSQGFLRRDGKNIVNDNGPVILRGIGLGGWMLQEGYMMQTQSFANAQYQIKAKIEAAIGEENTEKFYDAWLANYCTKADVDSLAKWGFNSIRLPMHYNLYTLPVEEEPVEGENNWLETGFRITDDLLAWCGDNQIYLILDLHAAPGGQGKESGISDYNPNKPSLWQSPENRAKTVALWRRLAERYFDEPWIGGYDLINETNWDMSNNTALKNLYLDITAAIREVDTRHIIFIEGNWFANDFTGLTPPWDDNMAYSFHKYWSFNDQGSIQWMLDIRNRHNIPIWCGEAGENSNFWYTEAISLLEDNNIGWAWWTLKKLESISGIMSVDKSSGYDRLLSYWNGNAAKPPESVATQGMMDLAENLKISNCHINTDVFDAMFRQVQTNETKPFKQHRLPGTFFAVDYDLGTQGYAYWDTESADYHVSTDNYTSWNNGWLYRNDGVDIESCSDPKVGNGFNVGWVVEDEWLKYTVDVDKTSSYDANLRIATQNSGKFVLKLDGREVSNEVLVNSTGAWQNWKDLIVKDVILQQGRHFLELKCLLGPFNLNTIQFEESRPVSDVAFLCLAAETSLEGTSIIATFNKQLQSPLPEKPGGFSIHIRDATVPIKNYEIDPAGFRLVFSVGEIYYEDVPKLSYSGDKISATDGTVLQIFNNLPVSVLVPTRHQIPGRIQAEDFDFNSGFGIENTTDSGGGQNLGWTNAGDYADYLVTIHQAGIYDVQYRVASLSAGGRLELLLPDVSKTRLHSITIPVTGGWQNWRTVTESAQLPKGRFKMRIRVTMAEFNLNWFEFQLVAGAEKITTQPIGYDLRQNYPNPFNGNTNIAFSLPREEYISLRIYNLLGECVDIVLEGKQPAGIQEVQWTPGKLSSGLYFCRLQTGGFTKVIKVLLQK
ncbi:carbohydrate-binding protein [candidate division KSB1 bacterium]|nr:carbohydrate-binding protein [candidate division KSB1 bacterium]